MYTSNISLYPEIYDMFDLDTVEDTLTKYLNLISDAKKTLSIPIIASINCLSANEWIYYAKKFQEAGADAIELNMFINPSDLQKTSEENEMVYFDVIRKIKKEVTIPIAMKISYYFSNLASMIHRLSNTGIGGLVLFNRFFSPDFDISNFRVVPASIYSTPQDLTISLRWIAIMAGRVDCDLCASTGVFSGRAAIKQLLAGASAVQVVSALYKNGIGYITEMLKEMEDWMEEMEYSSISEFKGKMTQEKSINPAVFERTQFMKHYRSRIVAMSFCEPRS